MSFNTWNSLLIGHLWALTRHTSKWTTLRRTSNRISSTFGDDCAFFNTLTLSIGPFQHVYIHWVKDEEEREKKMKKEDTFSDRLMFNRCLIWPFSISIYTREMVQLPFFLPFFIFLKSVSFFYHIFRKKKLNGWHQSLHGILKSAFDPFLFIYIYLKSVGVLWN